MRARVFENPELKHSVQRVGFSRVQKGHRAENRVVQTAQRPTPVDALLAWVVGARAALS